jgi:type II secretory pathway component GspD/PulD (secretin)
MKTIKHFLLITCLSAGLPALAADPAPGSPINEAPRAPATTIQTNTDQPPPVPTEAPEAAANTLATPAATALTADLVTNAVSGSNAVTGTNAAAPTVVVENGTNGLRLNFRGAPLGLVLDYLSDAAGFIINKEVDVRGTVEVWSKEPLTKDEAVEVLNAVLKKNGCAVIRNGRILTIVAQDGVNHKDTPIISGNNPDEVERGDEVVTQIIPVKYASVSQLVPNLELLLPTTATLTPNESANSLILVATKTDIKRMLKIITALDTSIASVSSIRVIPLKYADAKDTATLISSLFTSQGSGQGGGNAAGGRGNIFSMIAGGGGPFGGFGGGNAGGRGGGNAGGRGGGSGGGGGAAAAKVVAVGDDRSNSLVVSAPADLLATIENMVKEIDQEVSDVTELRVFRLVNADPAETADQLATLFPDPTASNSGSQNNLPFFMRGPGGGGGRTTATAAGSDRMKKMGRVLAVPDPRSSSIIITASKTMMPQIADMIAELDAEKGRKEIVGFYDLQNADPSDVYNNLQDLFQRNNVRAQNNNVNPNMGQNSPLYKRAQNNAQTMSTGTTSGFGSGSSRSGTPGGF